MRLQLLHVSPLDENPSQRHSTVVHGSPVQWHQSIHQSITHSLLTTTSPEYRRLSLSGRPGGHVPETLGWPFPHVWRLKIKLVTFHQNRQFLYLANFILDSVHVRLCKTQTIRNCRNSKNITETKRSEMIRPLCMQVGTQPADCTALV